MGVVGGQRRRGEKERKREEFEESFEGRQRAREAGEWAESKAWGGRGRWGIRKRLGGKWGSGAGMRGWGRGGWEQHMDEPCRKECSGGNRCGSSLHSSEVTESWQAAGWVPGTEQTPPFPLLLFLDSQGLVGSSQGTWRRGCSVVCDTKLPKTTSIACPDSAQGGN